MRSKPHLVASKMMPVCSIPRASFCYTGSTGTQAFTDILGSSSSIGTASAKLWHSATFIPRVAHAESLDWDSFTGTLLMFFHWYSTGILRLLP